MHGSDFIIEIHLTGEWMRRRYYRLRLEIRFSSPSLSAYASANGHEWEEVDSINARRWDTSAAIRRIFLHLFLRGRLKMDSRSGGRATDKSGRHSFEPRAARRIDSYAWLAKMGT